VCVRIPRQWAYSFYILSSRASAVQAALEQVERQGVSLAKALSKVEDAQSLRAYAETFAQQHVRFFTPLMRQFICGGRTLSVIRSRRSCCLSCVSSLWRGQVGAGAHSGPASRVRANLSGTPGAVTTTNVSLGAQRQSHPPSSTQQPMPTQPETTPDAPSQQQQQQQLTLLLQQYLATTDPVHLARLERKMTFLQTQLGLSVSGNNSGLAASIPTPADAAAHKTKPYAALLAAARQGADTVQIVSK